MDYVQFGGKLSRCALADPIDAAYADGRKVNVPDRMALRLQRCDRRFVDEQRVAEQRNGDGQTD